MAEQHYFLDADGKRTFLTDGEIAESDALTGRRDAMAERHHAEANALFEEYVALRDRVVARAAAERAAKP